MVAGDLEEKNGRIYVTKADGHGNGNGTVSGNRRRRRT